MDKLLLSAIIGLVAGIIAAIPMIIKKIPKYSTIATLFFYFFISIIIVNIDLPYMPWWLQGGMISLAMMTPIMIHVGHTDKKPLPIIATNSIIIGTLISIAGYFLA